jgi:peptide/nickel transport system substrate-binding protein
MTYALTIFNTWARGLDPATAGTAPTVIMNAIDGQLFRRDNGKIVPGLAAGYTRSADGKIWTIKLRPGVKFQDGTALNSKAVAWNFARDLKADCACNPSVVWPPFAKPGITTPDGLTVVLHFTRPFAAAMAVVTGYSPNHLASPTAFKKMGATKFSLNPVGAGPFEIVSNTPGDEVVLKRYAGYWQKGKPYLDKLVLKSVKSPQSAYGAIEAGQVQGTQLTSTALAKKAEENSKVNVTWQDGVAAMNVQLNTRVAPFNNKLARETIYYATNVKAIAKGIYDNKYPISQSFSGPGSRFDMPNVPGYRTYDLARAKSIVKQLGGLKVDLGGADAYYDRQMTKALQSQWQKAGIKVAIHNYQLPRLIQAFHGDWQAMAQVGGGWDPEIGQGLPFRYSSDAPYSGIHDPKLDAMIEKAAGTLDTNARAKEYMDIAKYVNEQAYSPFLLAHAPATVVADSVHGPGLTTKLPSAFHSVNWSDVWISK